jgi:amidophosphoribosyltransferase
LFGVIGHRDAVKRTMLGLHALQHRGLLGASMAVSDGDMVRSASGDGAVVDAMSHDRLDGLEGPIAVGMVRNNAESEIVFGRYRGGQLAVALSGRLTNGQRLRAELKEGGAFLSSHSDGEVLAKLLARAGQRTLVNRLIEALWKVEGGFAVMVLTEDRLIAGRDPRGLRPLVRGQIGDATVFASEEAAIRYAGGEVIADVAPGEVVIVDGVRPRVIRPFLRADSALCVQEPVALARADNVVPGSSVWTIRHGLGARLAREAPCPGATVVTCLSGGALASAQGFAQAARLRFEPSVLTERPAAPQTLSLVPNAAARMRWAVVRDLVEEASVVLVTGPLHKHELVADAVALLMEAGATSVHLRVAAPPLRIGCPYGVLGPSSDELLVRDVDAILRKTGVRSAEFLSREGLLDVAGRRADGSPRHCDACFSERLPLEPELVSDDQLLLFERKPS